MSVDDLDPTEDPLEYAQTMARAFANYPVMVRAFSGSPGGVGPWVQNMVYRSAVGRIASGIPVPIVRAEDRIVAGANLKLPSWEMLPELTGWFETFIRSAGPVAADFFPRFLDQVMESGLPDPHAYLIMIGVDPAHQGRGVGKSIIEDAARRAKEAGCLGLGLDTQDEKNVQIYRSCGFEVVDRRQVDDLPIWIMWREV
jgi:GNAT superfamily N-acetyltransferase